jgi:hypothetical protein
MVNTYKIESGVVVPSNDESGPVLVYINPTIEEKDILVGTFNIDSHTL